MRARSLAVLLILACVLSGATLSASPVAVRYKEGLLHGFLVLSTLDGTPLAEGDLTQVLHGNRITSHLIFRFKDGSRQEESVVFSQRRYFRLVSYHLVQKGPAFQHPTEITIAPSSGEVTVNYTEDDGKEKTVSERMKLPPDLANGIVLVLLKNLLPDPPPIEVSMVVPTPKPRLVKLAISSPGKVPFSLAGAGREAQHFVIKVQIGGIAGLVAPLLGKQPPDSHIWIEGGEAPTFVKSETIAYLGGPIWRVELVAPVWPRAATPESKNGSRAEQSWDAGLDRLTRNQTADEIGNEPVLGPDQARRALVTSARHRRYSLERGSPPASPQAFRALSKRDGNSRERR